MVSLISALEIQGNETLVISYEESGKLGYAITHDEKKYYRPILSCKPIYDDLNTALSEGKKVMKAIKELNLEARKEKLVNIIQGK